MLNRVHTIDWIGKVRHANLRDQLYIGEILKRKSLLRNTTKT